MDKLSKKDRSLNMSKVKSRDSLIEIKFCKNLWRQGVRYRKNVLSYIGKPDIVVKKYNTVIFIDSCFWHKCKLHSHFPKSNVQFWKEKLERNAERDKIVTRHYKNTNWKIFRIWEHQIDEDQKMRKVIKNIKKRMTEHS